MKLTYDQRYILEEANLPLLLLLEAEELNSDDEADASQEADAQGQNEDGTAQDPNQAQEPEMEEVPPSPEEVFAYELEGTEDKFLQFVLYDKLTELSQKIIILQDNIKNDSSVQRLELVQKLEHYQQYLEVLNELIFSISTSVVYKILGQIELELIDILQVYNAELEKHLAEEKLKK